MTNRFGAAVLALLLSQVACAQDVGRLIEQNVRSSTSAYKRLADESKASVPQLWIHVRSQEQLRLVQSNLNWFKALSVEGRKASVRPTQLVDVGPQQSQLRYFRQADLRQAQLLLAEIRKAIPNVVLTDMSQQYQQASWIEPGHFELWLAPSVTTIRP